MISGLEQNFFMNERTNLKLSFWQSLNNDDDDRLSAESQFFYSPQPKILVKSDFLEFE